MKKNILTILSLTLLMIFSACTGDKQDSKPVDKKAAAKVSSAKKQLPNYRYVDLDTVLAKYNLAKDYSEEMLRLQNNMESEARRHENSIKSFVASMEQKYKNNQYTEQSYNADQSKIQQMQNSAASSLDKMQRSAQESALAGEKVVQDSINNFIKQYNNAHHYDAILLKAATLYIDPELDITEEVVEGLNARYNKVQK